MTTRAERNWTAHLVISSEHAGLQPLFKQLQGELYRVLARCDDPHDVYDYVTMLILRSKVWCAAYEELRDEK